VTAVPFVGREAELASLHEAWEAARGGAARLLVVEAAPGAGKTALLERFITEAAPQRWAWVSCEPHEQELPWRVLGQFAAALSAWTDRTVTWAARDPESNPAHAGLPLIEELRVAGPAVLVLDDAQWADQQSQAVLRFVARHVRHLACLPVLLLVACRDGAEAGSAWRRAFPDAHGQLLELTGLSPEELARLAMALGRVGLSTAGTARLHEHTGGSPLFASEVLRQVQVRDINTGHGPLPAPRSVAGTVAAKLAARSEQVRAMADAAAVLGTEFDVELASALAGVADPASCLDELTDAGIVAEVPASASRRFRFCHALIHQAVYELAPLARRRELHAKAAALTGGAAGGVSSLRHRVAAAEGPDPVLAADLDRQADTEARRGELAAAASHRREALARTPPGDARSRRLLSMVEAKLLAGNVAGAAKYAAELAAGEGDPWRDYIVAYQLSLSGDFAAARRRLVRALDAPDGTAPRGAPADLRARIATQLALIALVCLSYQEMVEFGEIATAADSADRRVRAFAWFARTLGLTMAGHGGQALADLNARDPGGDLDMLVARGIAALWTDELDTALTDLSTAVSRAYQGEPLRVGQALGFLGDAEYRRGLLDAAVMHTEQAVWEAEEGGRIWDHALLHGLACQVRAARGDMEQALAHARAAEQAADLWSSVSRSSAGRLSAACGRAFLAQARGDAAGLLVAAEAVDALLDSPEPGITTLGPLRAEALARMGDAAAAAQALAEFTAAFGQAGRLSTGQAIDRVRGQIAAARGDHGAALASYFTALDLADHVGLPIEAAKTEMLMGVSLAAAGLRTGAGMRLRAALRALDRIGARAYASQAEALIREHRLPYDELPDPADPLADLTTAQREVAARAGDGLSNAAIAAQLSMSDKGVEQHLSRIYTELGLAGRPKRAALIRLISGPL
jgi:DNA-binding CsgD family transcriptional regulator